jgi:hypothetical protein
LVLISGCFSPSYDNGRLRCSVPDGKCPSGYYCAVDDFCWKEGQTPQIDMSVPDIAAANGRACTIGSQCTSGNCIDGYCCNSGCSSSCQACDVSGNLGTCTTVAAGLPHGSRTCTNQGQTCGGSCDGNTATCTYPDATKQCGVTCSSTTQLQKSFCDGGGSCKAAAPMTCPGNLICSGSACLSSCMMISDCASGYACSGNRCAPICIFDDVNSKFDDVCVYGP